MTDANLVFNPHDRYDPRSLVEIIISRLGGAIQSYDEFYGRLYRVHDWVYVLSESHDVDRRMPWYQLKNGLLQNRLISQVEFITRVQKDPDGSRHDTDFCAEEMLYLITQYMPHNNRGAAVRKYLADAGVLVDSIRRNPEVGYEAARQAFRTQGKDDSWIDTRIDGMINRHRFMNALKAVVHRLNRQDYGTATDDLYIGLWKRTKNMLLEQMDLPKNENLRDHQSRLALLFEGVAEEVCSEYLGKEQQLNWIMARGIIQESARRVGILAEQLGREIGRDIPTNVKLKPGYELPYLDGSGMPEDIKTPRPIPPTNS